ncbi:MAG: cytochrome P450 [Gammaproteobacteria bacterium]|nr:cytochrome P450 [Gammaproteobacteria bacterium]
MSDQNTSAHSEFLNLSDPKLIANFLEISKNLRPVCPLSTGGYLLLDHKDIREAFYNRSLCNQPSRFSVLSKRNQSKYVAASIAANIPPFLDSDRHTLIRRWLAISYANRLKSFNEKIESIADEILSSMVVGSEYLLVENMARRYSVEVMRTFLEIEFDDQQIKSYTSALFRLFAPAQSAIEFEKTEIALNDARQAILNTIGEEKYNGSLVTYMRENCPAALSGERYEEIIADNMLLLLADGVENVEAAIGSVLIQWYESDLRPSELTDSFVRKSIKRDTPGQTVPRICSETLRIAGEKINPGTPVFLSLSSANALAEKEDYSFGIGRHKCIGEKLAISMIYEFCRRLLQHDFTIDTSEIHYQAQFGHKWIRGVRIKIVSLLK